MGQSEEVLYYQRNMPTNAQHRNYRKTYKTPRRPYEKERLDAELKLVGEYGLRCKREIWRVQYALAKLRKAARTLLTLDPKDPKRIFEGAALLRRMSRYGLLTDEELELDYVLQLSTQKLLERRLDQGVQAGTRQVDPPRSRPYSPAS